MFLSRSTSNNAAQETSSDSAQDAAQVLRELPVELVVPNPSQSRRRFEEEALEGLAGSIGECGVLQPVLVRSGEDGEYELLAGERRWRAAKLAGLQSIPALVSRYNDASALELGLIENVARKDLNPVEEARACVTLAQELGLTYRQIGDRVGRAERSVSNLVRLPQLSEEILELVERGELSCGHGLAVLLVKDPDARLALARAAIEEEWTVRTLEARARQSNVDVLASQQDRGEQGQDPEQTQDPEQVRDLAALKLARAWGELLEAEVDVRVLRSGQMRMEVVFDSAAEGIALADRLAAAIARGSKGR
jgi:ParB family chromosome partitioning protein